MAYQSSFSIAAARDDTGRSVSTLPSEIVDIAYQNKRVIYGLLFKASAETMQTIAADPKHLGAKIAITSVLHTWGSAMTHHPHVHMIVPGGGLSIARGEEGDSPTGNKESERWVPCRKGFLLPVRVLSKLFRRLMVEKLVAAHAAGELNFYGAHAHLSDPRAFKRFLRPVRRRKWFVYAKRPFAGPKAVLAYLSRYTHRVAISNRRLIKVDANSVTFKVKNYRVDRPRRYTTMTLRPGEFIRRFLTHVLPKGLHRIRHYGLIASAAKAGNLSRMRELLGVTEPTGTIVEGDDEPPSDADAQPCPSCGSTMRIVETFEAGCMPHHTATPAHVVTSKRIDSS